MEGAFIVSSVFFSYPGQDCLEKDLYLYVKKIFQTFQLAIRGTEKEFTTGSIRRAIFLLAIPMVLEMVMESLFAVVDIYFVGKVGVDAQATVGLTESVLTLVYAMAIGLSMATTAMVARRIGEKNPTAAGKVAVQAGIMALAISLLVGLVGLFIPETILRMMGGSDTLISQGKEYTRIMLGGNATVMFIFLLNAVFRGAGDAAIAMRSLWLANGINLVLDPCLILGWGPFPEMGVAGAAIATNIGRGTGVIYQLWVLTRGKGIIRIPRAALKVEWATLSQLFRISLGGMGQFLIGSASWILLVWIVSRFGSEAVAGYTISFRIIVFTILPSWGLANAAAALVGQNLGARQPERAEKSVWLSARYNMAFLALIAVVFYVFAYEFSALFNDNPRVIEIAVHSLRIICAGYIFFAYGMVISQAFNGAGDTRTPTWVNFICLWLVQLPVAYLLAMPFEWGPDGVFWAIAISQSLLALVCIWLFKQGKWKSVHV